MKRVVTIATVAVLALSLIGCAGGNPVSESSPEPIDQQAPASAESSVDEQPKQEERQELSLAESGYWVDSEYGRVNYAVIVENPNMGWAVENAEIVITGKDASGNIVGSTTDYLTLLYANGKTAVCGSTYFDGVEEVEFDIVCPKNSWVQEEMQQAEFNELLYAEEINETTDEWGDTTVAGVTVNKAPLELSLATANVVFRASDGSIVGGEEGYLDTIAPESTKPFSVDYIANVPGHDSVEVYLDCGNLIEPAE